MSDFETLLKACEAKQGKAGLEKEGHQQGCVRAIEEAMRRKEITAVERATLYNLLFYHVER